MKLVSSITGTAAIRASNDDTGPKGGVLPRDLVAFVGDLYNFTGRPNPEIGPILQFQFGETIGGANKIIIQQLILAPDGDAVLASDTDLADAVMTDYFAKMDAALGFRFEEASPVREHVSVVVVEFDEVAVNHISSFGNVERIIGEAVGVYRPSYKIKQFSFGTDAAAESPRTASISQLLPSDFTIERRAGEPMERNRFFCRAPLTTSAHISALEAIEQAIIKGR